MINLTRTVAGKKLLKNGFKPVRFKAHGRVQSIGLCLYRKTGGDGILIEPFHYRSGVEYQISGYYIRNYHTGDKISTWATGRNLLKKVWPYIPDHYKQNYKQR